MNKKNRGDEYRYDEQRKRCKWMVCATGLLHGWHIVWINSDFEKEVTESMVGKVERTPRHQPEFL